MNAQEQLNNLFDSFQVTQEDAKKFAELKACFDENQIENFLDKLGSVQELDQYLDSSTDKDQQNHSDSFIDFISWLIIEENK